MTNGENGDCRWNLFGEAFDKLIIGVFSNKLANIEIHEKH